MRPLPLILALLPLPAASGQLYAASPATEAGKATTALVTTNDHYRPFLINNIYNYYANNGDGSYNPYTPDHEGFEFYKGDGKHVIFEQGVVWGGFHKGYPQPKVGGSAYHHALQAGPLVSYGTRTTDPVPADPSNPAYRIYRIRPDMNPNTVSQADGEAKLAVDEIPYVTRDQPSITAASLFQDYVKDWNEWPASQGAPFAYGELVFVNDTVRRHPPVPYDPKYDIPGYPKADQTLWYVANDMDTARVSSLAGCPPIGLEMQRTIWGYKRAGSLGNTIFAATLLVNKSGADVDSMFLGQWADPDLGDAGDDLVGCDTTRDLGYVYNAPPADKVYGAAVPAAGFMLLEGPRVPSPGNTAFFRGRSVPGYRNLPMTSFAAFAQGNAAYADPKEGPGGNVEWYHSFNGTIASTGAPLFDPIAKKNTKFVFPSDPLMGSTDCGTGWLDGYPPCGLAPQDRRMMLSSGPFHLAAGDTQEIVVAAVVGLGGDRLSSIVALRKVCDDVRLAFSTGFTPPQPPPAPIVRVAQLDGQVVLSWGDQTTIAKTEGSTNLGYHFEGYNLYELPGPSFQNPAKLATFDLADGVTAIIDTVPGEVPGVFSTVLTQRGSDSGLRHWFRVGSSKVTGQPLINGSRYYFALSAYNYNPHPLAVVGTHALESAPTVFVAIPQSPAPGTRYGGRPGDTLAVSPAGQVTAVVVDPTRLTGHTYAVRFTGSDSAATWSLTDLRKNGAALLQGQTVQPAGGTRGVLNDGPVVDGLMVRVVGPPQGAAFTFTAPGNTVDDPTLMAADVQAINVYPNPYLGFNPQEINKYQRFVTFTHLPRKAILRIFTLSGTLVRTLLKDDPTQFLRWDLLNEEGYFVAGAMYIVEIELPDLGVTRIVKLAVIPEQFTPDRW